MPVDAADIEKVSGTKIEAQLDEFVD